jgi:hypothetical protein
MSEIGMVTIGAQEKDDNEHHEQDGLADSVIDGFDRALDEN